MTDPDHPARPGSSRSITGAARPASIPASPRPASVASARPTSRQQPAPPAQSSHQQAGSQQRRQDPSPPAQPQPTSPINPPSSPHPPFQPLFTLLTTTTARGTTTHHPRVHYIFSDDDPDELTQALARHHASLAPDAAEDDPSAPGSATSSRHSGGSGAPQKQPRDRAVVLDLMPRGDGSGGFDVAWASSLSADWAVVGARVTRMEGDDGGGAGAEADDGPGAGLMLRIEGVGADYGIAGTLPLPGAGAVSPEGEMQLSGGGGSGRQSAPVQEEDYSALIDEFDRRMGVLKKVVDAGEERRWKIAADAEAEGAEEQQGGQEHPTEESGEEGHAASGD